MAHEEALATVNLFRSGMSDFARLVVESLRDGKQTSIEAFRITTQGMMLAADLVAVIGRLDAEGRADLLYVLEHATLVLPSEPRLL